MAGTKRNAKKTSANKTDSKLLQQQINELTQALQRERADATNIRRRHEEEIANLRTRIKSNVVRDLLPVIDNFELSLKHLPADLKDHDYVKGVQGIVKQFESTLKDLGVEKIKTVGQEFNPAYHEAVSMEEGQGNKEIISEELRAGYKSGKDIIRHATVRVKMQK